MEKSKKQDARINDELSRHWENECYIQIQLKKRYGIASVNIDVGWKIKIHNTSEIGHVWKRKDGWLGLS